MITKNEIYTKLIEDLEGVYCTQFYEVIPQSLPCLYFRTSHSPIRRNLNLDYSDKQMKMFVYVEIYGLNIEKIANHVEDKMREMHFIEELSQMLPNQDPTIERISMRFQRVITESDIL